jgi:hypothetical protein
MLFEKVEAVGSEELGPMMLKPNALSKKLHACNNKQQVSLGYSTQTEH